MEKSLSEKQLIVVVEGTASMGPYWKTIISDYLEKIIRIFCASKIPRQNLSDECLPELGLVVFNVHGPYSPFIVQQSGLTKDVDLFLRYLTTLPMSGGSFSEGAIAEGLAESLMMFSQNPDCHKHCILVAASNPYPFPTPISKPVIQNAENHDKYEVQIETCLSDAETVAKSFSKNFFSLSIISPRQLPKLQAIYNAGKHDSQSADPVVNNEKNPYFLILLSENFVEGCIALALPVVVNKQTDQRIVMMDGSMGRAAAHVQSISMSPQTHSTENEAIANQTILSEGNNIASIVKNMNPQNAEPSLLASSGFPHTPSIINSITQGGQIPSTSSTSPPSLDLQEFRHIVNPSPQSLHPVGPPAHSNILNNLSRTHQVLASASITGGTSIELQTNGEFSTVIPGPNIITDVIVSSSVSRSGTVSKNVQTTQNTVTGSLTYSNSNLSPNLSVSSPLSNLQDNVGMNQSLPNIGQANIISGISGILQQSQHGLNSLAVNKPLQICTSGVQQLRPKYDKIWEGALWAQRNGQSVCICNLEGYKRSTSSNNFRLAEDWPSSMQIVRLISCDFMTNKEYTMKAEFLVFRPLSQHPLFDQLHDKKLCAVINIPHRTLFLSFSNKSRLIGMILNNAQFQPPQQQPQRVPPINQSSMLEDSGRSQIMTEGIIQQQQQQQSQSNTLPPPGGNFNSK